MLAVFPNIKTLFCDAPMDNAISIHGEYRQLKFLPASLKTRKAAGQPGLTQPHGRFPGVEDVVLAELKRVGQITRRHEWMCAPHGVIPPGPGAFPCCRYGRDIAALGFFIDFARS